MRKARDETSRADPIPGDTGAGGTFKAAVTGASAQDEDFRSSNIPPGRQRPWIHDPIDKAALIGLPLWTCRPFCQAIL